MTNQTEGIYLTAGVFFAILQTALKQRTGARTNIHGESDGLAQTNMFADLLRVVDPSFLTPDQGSTFSGNVSQFRTCQLKGNTTYVPVGGSQYVGQFKALLAKSPNDALDRMANFIDTYLDVDTHGQRLVARLLYLLNADRAISSHYRFLAGTQYEISKPTLVDSTDICLDVLLLALWAFVSCERLDNKQGRQTFLQFFRNTGSNTQWEFLEGSMPVAPEHTVRITRWSKPEPNEVLEPVIVDEDETDSSAYAEDPCAQEHAHVPAGGFVQQIGQQTTFIMNGDNGTQIQHVETLHLGGGQ